MHSKTKDVQVVQPDGEVLITNDGATILQKMTVQHPAAKMLVDLSKSQVCPRGLPPISFDQSPGCQARLASQKCHAKFVPDADGYLLF